MMRKKTSRVLAISLLLVLAVVLAACKMPMGGIEPEGSPTQGDSADHKVAMEQTIEKDGREIILNSGCGWSFTATQAQAQNRDLKERARSLLGIDLDRYIGKGIDVQSYDTLIRGQGSWDSKRTYLFVFVGDELLYQEDFEGTEHFSAVVELCTQLMQ